MKNFIKSRAWKNIDSGPGYYKKFDIGKKFPNKLELEDAIEGKDCLVLRALDLRSSQIIFRCPDLPSEPSEDPYNPPWLGPVMDKVNPMP